MKIISGIALITGVMALIACSSVSTPSQPQTASQWEQKYPEVFNNAGYSKLIKSASLKNSQSNLSESYLALRGTVTNTFGIRDDVLNYVITNIKKNNTSFYAALRVSQLMQQQMLESTPEKVLNISQNMFIAVSCIKLPDINQETNFIRQLNYLYRNTALREQREKNIESILNGKFIDPNMTMDDIKNSCNRMDY